MPIVYPIEVSVVPGEKYRVKRGLWNERFYLLLVLIICVFSFQIKESNLQEVSFLMELYCTSQFSTLLTIAQDILHALKEQGETLQTFR